MIIGYIILRNLKGKYIIIILILFYFLWNANNYNTNYFFLIETIRLFTINRGFDPKMGQVLQQGFIINVPNSSWPTF